MDSALGKIINFTLHLYSPRLREPEAKDCLTRQAQFFRAMAHFHSGLKFALRLMTPKKCGITRRLA
jgi:hypothetical protein